ncbi:MAG: cytochrome P450 [Deltaproteobacteria bacterium]|nr:cytochrome P450 [Deltaproteobacteria bacterium]
MASSLRDYFNKLDTSGDGRVSEDEIRAALIAGDLDVSDEFVAELIRECDQDGDGQIDFQEFVDAYARQTTLAGLDLAQAKANADFGPRLHAAMARTRAVAIKFGGPALAVLAVVALLRPSATAHFFASIPTAVWVFLAGVVAALAAAILLVPGLKMAAVLLVRGLDGFHAAHKIALGLDAPFTDLGTGRLGKPAMYVQDEQLVAQVLRAPQKYARLPMANYPPFEALSELGAGSGEEWLKYRIAFKDYFASGYKDDLPELRAIVEERMPAWIAAGEVNLLGELYRILVEIRGRLFYQSSFDCYDPNAKPNFADEVDEVLSPPVLLFGANDGSVDLFHARILKAIRASTKPGSVGHICRTMIESGEWTEEEAIQNGSLFMLAHAPTMVLFWAMYRIARDGTGNALRASRKKILQALKEEMRLHPGVPTMLPRLSKEENVIGPMRVAKGTTLLVSPYLIHNSRRHWANPEKFDPECWEIGENDDPRVLVDGRTDPEDKNRRPSACPFHKLLPDADAKRGGRVRFLPFGGGQHQCQGRWFAADEMFAVVQSILKHVDLEVAPGQQDLLSRSVWDRVTLHVYSRPMKDIRVRVRPLAKAESAA